jgi:hypothetical protein
VVELEKLVQDHPTKEKFEIYIENLKQEAISQFDQDLYGDCLDRFRILCELEPENQMLKDYLEQCHEMADKAPSPGTHESQASERGDRKTISELMLIGQPQSCRPLWLGQDDPNCVESEGKRQAPLEMMPIPAKKMAVGLLILVVILLLGISLDIWRIHQRPVSEDSSSVKPDADGKIESSSPEPLTQKHRAKTQGVPQLTESFERETPQGLSAVRLKSKDLGGSAHLSMPDRPATERSSKTVPISAQAKAARSEPQKSRLVSVPPNSADSPGRKQSQEVLVLPVIHDHFLGSCRGTLTVSRKSVTFEPFTSSSHGFEAKPTEVSLTNLGDRLEVSFNNKSYRFKVDPKVDKAENRTKLEAISQHLKKIKAGNKPE